MAVAERKLLCGSVLIQTHRWFGLCLLTCAKPVRDMQAIGQDAQVPLFNAQLDMDSREQINEALTTGVKVSAMLTSTKDSDWPLVGPPS